MPSVKGKLATEGAERGGARNSDAGTLPGGVFGGGSYFLSARLRI